MHGVDVMDVLAAMLRCHEDACTGSGNVARRDDVIGAGRVGSRTESYACFRGYLNSACVSNPGRGPIAMRRMMFVWHFEIVFKPAYERAQE